MPFHGQAAALLELARALREGLEALEAPEAATALADLRRIRDRLEAVATRGTAAETAALTSGAPLPRFRRLS